MFGVPSPRTRRIADQVAAGAAGGARNASYAYFKRRDYLRLAGVLGGGLIIFQLVTGDDDTPAPATETAEAAPITEGISSPLNVGHRGADVIVL